MQFHYEYSPIKRNNKRQVQQAHVSGPVVSKGETLLYQHIEMNLQVQHRTRHMQLYMYDRQATHSSWGHFLCIFFMQSMVSIGFTAWYLTHYDRTVTRSLFIGEAQIR